MRKALLLAAAAALALSGALWGQSITVTSPNGSSNWCQGSNCNAISWTSSGVAGPLSIKLRLAGAPTADPVLSISDSTANDGSFLWDIPASLAPGTYLVRVRTVSNDPLVYGDSADFTINVCAGGTITVDMPNGSSYWSPGSSHEITWNAPGVAGPLSIKLRQEGVADPVLSISDSTGNDGSLNWPIPESLATGTYLVRVRTVSDSPLIYGDSHAFHIATRIVIPPDWWKKKYYEVRFPPGPDPCLCPEWDIRELLEKIREVDPRFIGSLSLLKNGEKIQELGKFGGRNILGNTLKPNLSRKNFAALKNGTAKFSMGVFDAQGKLMGEILLQGEQQQLR